MTDAEKRMRLVQRIEGAAADLLACSQRIRDRAESDDIRILLEAAQDAHTDALELAFVGGEVA